MVQSCVDNRILGYTTKGESGILFPTMERRSILLLVFRQVTRFSLIVSRKIQGSRGSIYFFNTFSVRNFLKVHSLRIKSAHL